MTTDMLADERPRPYVPTSVDAPGLNLNRVSRHLLRNAGYTTLDAIERASDEDLFIVLRRRSAVRVLREASREQRRSEQVAFDLYNDHGLCLVPTPRGNARPLVDQAQQALDMYTNPARWPDPEGPQPA
jgi:hypothetical protein